MRCNVWAGVKHCNVLLPKQVGVGAGPRHGSRIGGDDPAYTRVQPHCFTMFQHDLPQIRNFYLWIDIFIVINTLNFEPEQLQKCPAVSIEVGKFT